jgi:hypothetical protein
MFVLSSARTNFTFGKRKSMKAIQFAVVSAAAFALSLPVVELAGAATSGAAKSRATSSSAKSKATSGAAKSKATSSAAKSRANSRR